MLKQATIKKIKAIYTKHLSSLNEWEKGFVSDMFERVMDAEGQELPLDEYFITRRQSEKIDQIWSDLGF